MIIRDQFDPDLRKLIKKKKQIAIIPVGSIEQHGPHLPISTDSDIVTEISLQLSDKINGVLLPTINYGISDEHFPFFNLSIKKYATPSNNIYLTICIIVALISTEDNAVCITSLFMYFTRMLLLLY